MIQWFSKVIEQGLNDLAVIAKIPRTFVIYADAGERPDVAYNPTDERAAADIEGKVYGVFDAQPSRMAPIPGITVVSITGTLSLLPEVKLSEGVGQFSEVSVIEDILESFGRANNGKTYAYTDEDGTEFNVSVNFSPVVSGDWQMHSTALGETIPLNMSVYLTAVQKGVSSNDVTVYVDGYPIFYESLLVSRQKTLDQFTYEEESIKSVTTQHAFGVDIVFPLLKSRISKALLAEILDGSFTTPHSVVLSYPDIEREYMCVLGPSNAPAKPGQNVGLSVSFVEAKKDVALKEIGTRLRNLGEHFSSIGLVTINAGDSLTPARLDGVFGFNFEVGKRYTVAAALSGYYPTVFKTFEYTAENRDLILGGPFDDGATMLVRITYGE